MVPRRLLAAFAFLVDVTTNSVAKFDVCFSASCPMISRGSSSLNMASFGGSATIGVPTLEVGFSQSWRVSSRCFCWLHLRFGVDDVKTGVATLVVDFPTSCQMSRGSSKLNRASFRRITTTGVATLSVVLPAPCLVSSQPRDN
jgi:hypothetical protein